jgi:hypothetical protein
MTSTGKEQVAIKFELSDYPGVFRTWYGYFTEATWERTLEALRICGWKGDDLTDLTGISDNAVSLVLLTEEYKGEFNQKVKFVNAPNSAGVGMKNKLAGDGLKSFAASMKAKIRSAGRSRPAPVARPESRTRGGSWVETSRDDGNEDIPF